MTYFQIFLLAAFIVLGTSFPAAAQHAGVVHCGSPEDSIIETDPGFEFCDVYQTQLEYRESWQKLRADLLERQENYAAPRRAAYEQYRKDLEALHESIE